jgi:glucokinase
MALATLNDEQLEIQHEASLPSADYPTLESMLEAFLGQAKVSVQEIMATVLAVAGPVQTMDQQSYCRLTNLPWEASSKQLSTWLNHTPVEIINDFAAIAYALSHIETDDLEVLQDGKPDSRAPLLAVGAGTGLGLCMVDQTDALSRIYTSETGHVHFAPADIEQLELTRYWLEKQGHCTREFILSGPGIQRIAEYLQQTHNIQAGVDLGRSMREGDASAALSKAAMDQSDELAQQTMRLFIRIYAGQLSDLALTYLPRGGLYIAGGVAARILPLMKTQEFLDAFLDNPTMRSLLEQIPLKVITTYRSGLIGALHHARDLLA